VDGLDGFLTQWPVASGQQHPTFMNDFSARVNSRPYPKPIFPQPVFRALNNIEELKKEAASLRMTQSLETRNST
jgi:hypothetical protein